MKKMQEAPTRSNGGRGTLLLLAIFATILACGVQPTAAQTNSSDGLNMTANRDMFSGAVRQLLRFVLTLQSKAEVDDLVSKGPTIYKSLLATVSTLPTNITAPNGTVVQLPSSFEVAGVRRLSDTSAQVEVAVKLVSEAQGAVVQDFINKNPNFTQWASKTWATAQEMKPNRAVMVSQRIDAVFTPGMTDKNSTAFTTFRDQYLPAFKAIIQAKVPEVTDVVLLALSAGSVVADTAILVNGSGSNSTTSAITSTANSTTTVGNMTTQTVSTNSNSTYIAPSDTVNSVASQTANTTNTTTTPVPTTVANATATTAPGNTTTTPVPTTTVKNNSTTASANSTTASANSTTASANSTTASSNSTTASSNSTTVRSNTTTTAPGATTSAAGAANGSATTTGTGTSSGTTTPPGTTTTKAGATTASASGSSGSAGSSSFIQTNGLFVRPGTSTTDLDVATQTDYFTPETRFVLRYAKTVTPASMTSFLDETSTNYKDEATMVSLMPKAFDPGNGGAQFTLTEPFSLKMSRQQGDTLVEFECAAKATAATQVDIVIAYFTNTAPYSTSLPNKKWSLGRDMIPNRVVPLATRLNKPFLPQYLNHSSAEFTALKNSFLPSLLLQLQAKEPKVERLMILSVSQGSTVVESAALVNSSGNAASTTAINSAAAGVTSVGGVNATNLPASGNTQTYVTASDSVNSGEGYGPTVYYE